jgi:hypothetical protein
MRRCRLIHAALFPSQARPQRTISRVGQRNFHGHRLGVARRAKKSRLTTGQHGETEYQYANGAEQLHPPSELKA